MHSDFLPSRRSWLLPVLLLSFLSAGRLAARPPETGFLNRTLRGAESQARYVVYVPAEYTKARRWPVILCLHGAGERGADGLLQTQVGLPEAIRRHCERWPALVVMPQCSGSLNWNYQTMADVALGALAATEREFRTDPDRVYLTGLSMGGYGSWFLASQYPGRWAAVVPVCGGALLPTRLNPPQPQPADPYGTLAQGIGAQLPIWAFHGAQDPIVPVSESQKLVAGLRALGNPIQYTEYPDVAHDAWVRAYDDPALPIWLFAQQRSKAPRK